MASDLTNVDGVSAEVARLALQHVDAWTSGGRERADDQMNAAALNRAISEIIAGAYQRVAELEQRIDGLAQPSPLPPP